jgi:hypothetical protein
MYRDYAISPEPIIGESQSTTSSDSPKQQRCMNHATLGGRIPLFCSETNPGDFGARPCFFLGTARYFSHTGSRPMAITWKVDHPIPADFYESASILAG